MRDNCRAATCAVADTTPAELVQWIVGRTPIRIAVRTEVAHCVPAPPEGLADNRPGAVPVTQSCDVLATTDGLLYVTDTNAGLSVLEFDGS